MAESMQASESTFTPGPREAPPRPIAITRPLPARIAMAQGAWLLLAGCVRAFERAGTGMLLANVGASLLYAGARGDVWRPMRALGATLSLSLAGLDFYRASTHRVRTRKHLFDGLMQLGFAAAWIASEVRDTLRLRRPPEPAFA